MSLAGVNYPSERLTHSNQTKTRLDRSLALRFKSRRGLPRVGTARNWIHKDNSCSSERGRGVTLALRFCLRRVYERFELRDFSLFLTVAGVHLGPSLRLRVQRGSS